MGVEYGERGTKVRSNRLDVWSQKLKKEADKEPELRGEGKRKTRMERFWWKLGVESKVKKKWKFEPDFQFGGVRREIGVRLLRLPDETSNQETRENGEVCRDDEDLRLQQDLRLAVSHNLRRRSEGWARKQKQMLEIFVRKKDLSVIWSTISSISKESSFKTE